MVQAIKLKINKPENFNDAVFETNIHLKVTVRPIKNECCQFLTARENAKRRFDQHNLFGRCLRFSKI